MTTIPASEIVDVNPSVLGAGGTALDLVGLMLTTNVRPPIGSVLSFPDAESVSDYFGASAPETSAASIYFQGFDNAGKRPGAMLFAQYPTAAVAAYLRGGDVSNLTLAELQAANGQFIYTVNATQVTIADLDLSAATSFSNAAAIIQTALQAGANPDSTCVYDSTSGAFIITSPTTGAASTITFASGTGDIVTILKLTAALGAVTSQGADAVTSPATFMNAMIAVNANWASFSTMFDPDVSGNTNKMAFAAWKNTQNNRFAYVAWDLDQTPTNSLPAAASMGALLDANGDSGTALLDGVLADGWSSTAGVSLAAFLMGSIASVDFEETNGRVTFAFKAQAGMLATVTTATAANNLGGSPQGASRGNGYNFYGAYGAANAGFTWFQRGFVTGPFLWLDAYINQIWLNNALQLALLRLFETVRSIPFTTAGNTLIENAIADVINAGLNFGIFAPGVLSQSQKAQVNQAAGANIADTIQTQGYYVQVVASSAAVRSARGPVNVKFWYLDSGAVQSISLDSIAIQ